MLLVIQAFLLVQVNDDWASQTENTDWAAQSGAGGDQWGGSANQW